MLSEQEKLEQDGGVVVEHGVVVAVVYGVVVTVANGVVVTVVGADWQHVDLQHRGP